MLIVITLLRLYKFANTVKVSPALYTMVSWWQSIGIIIIHNLFLSFNHLSNSVIENSSVTEIHQFHVSIKSTLCLK